MLKEFCHKKQEDLMALGIAITIRCDGYIACNRNDMLLAIASAKEITETISQVLLTESCCCYMVVML